jgi:hypothetical protein
MRINETRLRKAEARAPQPFEEREVLIVIVDPSETFGGTPRGVYRRTRSIPGGSIEESFEEPLLAAETLPPEMMVTRRYLRRGGISTVELFDPPIPESKLPSEIDGEAVERNRRS